LQIAFVYHQPARDRADASLYEARMVIENKAADAGVTQQGLRPGQSDDVVGPEQFPHSPLTGLRPAYVRHLTRSVLLCSLAFERVKPRRSPRRAKTKE
jgi:hypothetical protein